MNSASATTSHVSAKSQSLSGHASWASRAGAAVIDGLVLIVPTVIAFLFVEGAYMTSPTREPLETTADIVGHILAFGAVSYAIAYALCAAPLMARSGPRNGQTLGKQMMGIRVVRRDNAPYRYGSALLREIGAKGLLWIWIVPALVSYIWPLIDAESRALHDKMVSSLVLRA